jgi:hypothetical protein
MGIFNRNCYDCGIEMKNGYLYFKHKNGNTKIFCKKCRKKYQKNQEQVSK